MAVVVVALVGACEAPSSGTSAFEDLPIRYTTDELRIATAFDEPLCEGDLRWLDAHTRRVEEALASENGSRRTVYVYDSADILREADDGTYFLQIAGCGRNDLGCYNVQQNVALGVPAVLPHELVHAISADLDPSYGQFWDEGLAEALSEHPIVYIPASIEDVASGSGDFSYQVAGHFTRWLIDWRGLASVLRVVRGEAFEDVYGVNLGDVEELYDVEAREVMPSSFACQGERVPIGENGSFAATIDLRCDSAGTTRLQHGRSLDLLGAIRFIEPVQGATYSVEVEGADTLGIGGCQAVAGELEEMVGDVVNDANEAAGVNPASVTEVRDGDEVFLPAATYRVVLAADDEGQPQTVRFSLTPVE